MVTKLLPTGDCSDLERDFPLNVAIKASPVVGSVTHGQRIQTRAFFRDDGSGGVRRVRSNCVLYSSCGSWQDCGGTVSLCDRGLKAGEQAPADAIFPTDAELNMMAQKYFKQQGSGDRQSWDLTFENGYADGFKKTHGR